MKKFLVLMIVTLMPMLGVAQVQPQVAKRVHRGTVAAEKQFCTATLLSDAKALHNIEPIVPVASNQKARRASSDYTTEEVNEYGIIMAPAAGEERLYTRVGKSLRYSYMNETFSAVEQTGGLTLVECPDGTIYMKQPLSNYGIGFAADAWIKGHREDYRLVFAGDQMVNFVTMYGMDAAVTVCRATYNAQADHGYQADRTAPIVFVESEDGYQIFLEGTDQQHIIGAFWDDGDFALAGDFETELVLDEEAFTETAVTPPDGLQTEYFIIEGIDYRTGQPLLLDAEIGFDGDDVYLTGFSTTLPESWIAGRRDGNHLTFPMAQFIGRDAGNDIYAYGGYLQNSNVAISDFYLTYNPDKNNYKASTGLLITRGKVTSQVYIAEYLSGISLYKPGEGGKTDVEIRYDVPEGTLKTYARLGGSYYTFFGYVLDGRQEGKHIDIVYAPDGKTVYMMNPISQASTEPGAWVAGYKGDDGKIHMPLGQYTYQDPDTKLAMQTAVLRLTVTGDAASPVLDFVYDDSYDEVTFSVSDDGTLTLDALTDEVIYEGYPSTCYGLIYDDDLTWTGYADYDTQYVPFADALTTIPRGVTQQKWAYMYNDGTNDVAEEVMVGIDGDKFYMAGLNANDPEAAVVGTISDGKVSFASDQYVGNSAYGIFLYFVGAYYTNNEAYDEEFDYHYVYRTYEYLPELVFNYNPDLQRLTSDGEVCIVINQGLGSTGVFTPIAAGLQPWFNGYHEVAATPASPSVLDYGFYYEDYGYDVAEFYVPTKDTEGNYISTDKLYYIIWTRTDGENSPIVFTTDLYEGLDRELTEVPYDLTVTNTSGWSSVIAGAKRIVLFETGFDNLGIQSVYYGAGERRTSPIVWWQSLEEEGVASVLPDNSSRDNVFYSLDGRRCPNRNSGSILLNSQGRKLIVR